MLKNRILRTTVAAAAFTGIGLAGFLQCSRNNPIDPDAPNYISGTRPEVRFLTTTATGFIKDVISIPVECRDTQALGGKTPEVKQLYFYFNGDSVQVTDSMTVSVSVWNTVTFTKIFQAPKDTFIFVRAKDNDNVFSPAAMMRLTISEGKPRLSGNPVIAPDSVVLTGDSVSITVSAADTNGTITGYIWIVNGGTPDTTVDSTLTIAFGVAGVATIQVKALDEDSVVSPTDTVRITVNARIDSIPPEIQFMSPHNGDTVSSATITVAVQARDPSGILFVYINSSRATKFSGADTAWQIWQRDVSLIEGTNKIPVWTLDNSDRNNQRTDTLTVIYRKPDNTPPTIMFSTPQPNDTIRDTLYASPVTVVVSVSDQSGIAWVKCGGDTMSKATGNSYTRDVTLQEGIDTLIITAEDTKGNMAADTLIVTYMLFRDAAPPTIRIFSPQPNQWIGASSVTVVVYVFDTTGPIRSGVASVTVNGLSASLAYGHYMRSVPLAHGYDTLRIVATDSSANQARDSVIVLQNGLPRFDPDSLFKDTSLLAGSVDTIPVCAMDPDSDTFVFSIISWPNKSSTIPVIVPRGGGCADIAGYSPNSTGVDTFKVRVTDSYSAADTLRIRVFISAGGDTKPYFTTDSAAISDTGFVGVLYSVLLTAEDPNDSTLTYSLGTPPTPAGAAIDSITGVVSWTPAAADLGQHAIAAFVSNGSESDTLSWTVTVVQPNLSPVLQNPGNKIVDEGRLLQFTLAASDPNSDTLKYSFGETYPFGATLDSISGVFNWTPTYQQSGVYPIVLKVTEKNRSPALSDSVTDTITVNNVNNPPVLVNPGDTTVYESQLLTFALQATDINGDSIRFSMSGAAPMGAMILNSVFIWRPTAAQGGQTYTVTFVAADNGVPVMRDTESITIRVIDSTVPVFDPHPPEDTAVAGLPFITTVHAVDGDSDNVAYRKLLGPDSLTVDQKYGTVAWRPAFADLGFFVNVAVIAEDHAGNADTVSWRIRVLRWPRIFWSPGTNDTGYSVIERKDVGDGGGYALCGTIRLDSATTVGFLITTDTSGNPLVFEMYPGTAGHVNLFSLQQTAPDNGFIMCGSDSSAGEIKLLLIKANDRGIVEWLKQFSDSRGLVPSAKGACVWQTRDNGFVACGAAIRRGIIFPTAAPFEAYLLKTDASGGFMWDRMYTNQVRASAAYSVQQTSSDGGYILCGEIALGGATAGTDAYCIKTNASGDTIWTRSYNKGMRDVGLSVLEINGMAGNGGYCIGGFSTNNMGGMNGVLLRVNMAGDTVGSGWMRSLPFQSAIASVRPTVDGDFIACGSGAGPGGGDALLYRFSGDGKEVWTRFHGGSLIDGGYSAVQTRDGGFILTGFYTLGAGGTDVYLLKTDANGLLAK